jgi:predicted nucleic acid-binding protein
MSREFADTCVVVYAHDRTAGAKHVKSIELLTRLFEDRTGAVSVQVLSEFYEVATRKKAINSDRVEAAIRDLGRSKHSSARTRGCSAGHRAAAPVQDPMVGCAHTEQRHSA